MADATAEEKRVNNTTARSGLILYSQERWLLGMSVYNKNVVAYMF
jgi:hypothetical protein